MVIATALFYMTLNKGKIEQGTFLFEDLIKALWNCSCQGQAKAPQIRGDYWDVEDKKLVSVFFYEGKIRCRIPCTVHGCFIHKMEILFKFFF